MMDKLIERFPAQLTEALEIGRAATIRAHSSEIRNIHVAGMGGSGIGANFVREFIINESRIPFSIGKGYGAPAFIDKHTLVIVSSYSGNTEETLNAYEQIKDSGAKIVFISSGGKAIQFAKETDMDFIQVPGDWPSPRACLGFSLVQQLFVLNKLGIIGTEQINSIERSIDLITSNQEDIREKAQHIAQLLNGKIPIIYTTDRMESVAVRFRQQVNENAKMLGWHGVVPEMNHNELVGWTDVNPNLAVIYFRNKDDFNRNQVRIEINKEIIGKYTSTIIDLYSKGNDLVEKSIYFVNLGDWISYYMCELHGADSIEVNVIDYLKSELGKV